MTSEGSNPNASSSGSTSTTSSNVQTQPLWKYVTRLEKKGVVGGTWEFQCNFCGQKRSGSYSRVKTHLLQQGGQGIKPCTKVTRQDRVQMIREEEEFENKKKESANKEVPLPSQSQSNVVDSSSKKRRADVSSNPILKLYDMSTREELDEEIARMFYTGGLPFNLARNPHYVRSYHMAATMNLPGYRPPGYTKLRTTLLVKEKANCERLLQPIQATWKDKGVTIVSDGWSDPTRKPLINFMASSGKGPMFLKAVNCFGEFKDKFFISDLMKEVIENVGHQNVVQIITDNAPNCKGAGEIIESIYPHIYWTPCVVHTLNLALKNICAAKNTESNVETYALCNWITEVHGDAIQVKNYIMNHNMRLAMFTRFTPLKLLSVAETRFASIIVMLKRFKLIKRPLQTMVISEEWSSYREDDPGKASFAKEKILSDEWWDQIDYILDFIRPIYDMIRACDTDKPTLHLVYEMWDSMIEKVKVEIYKKEKLNENESCPFWDVVYDILIARWIKSYTPLHCLAHSLNPRYYSSDWLNEDSSRIAPHRDAEISRERMKCFRRIFPNSDEQGKVYDEYAQFSLMMGSFEDPISLSKRSTGDPLTWWANFGADTPLLQSLAFKLLGQPSSSSCCERNWSTYAFIHSLRRNRLNPSRAEDLVFIHNNLRLLSRNSDAYQDEKNKLWDVGGDTFDSMDDVGFLEFAELSLDESELENELINDNP